MGPRPRSSTGPLGGGPASVDLHCPPLVLIWPAHTAGQREGRHLHLLQVRRHLSTVQHGPVHVAVGTQGSKRSQDDVLKGREGPKQGAVAISERGI